MHGIGNGLIELVVGDIVEQHVDAIVNAANERMLGGGGVDGAIHRAAGPRLLEACRAVPADAQGRRCPTGEVRLTPGADLPARFVIHGVGPVYAQHPPARAAALLRSVHTSALAVAAEHELTSIAFPAISTGVFGYPVDDAARVAIGAAVDHLAANPSGPLKLIRFVLFDARTRDAYDAALAQR